MSLLPDETRHIPKPMCSGCGAHLHCNQRAIYFDEMAGNALLIGDCCADRVLGALIQDYSTALSNYSHCWPSHWITRYCAHRMAKVAQAAKVISDEYTNAIPGLRYVSKGEQK
jgi:hypothetical protein